MEVRYPPLKRGISAILARYPMKTRQMGAIPPSAILSRKGIARYGGVSRSGPLREFLKSKEKKIRVDAQSASDSNRSDFCYQIERRFGCDFAERSAFSNSQRTLPKNILRLFFASKIIFIF